jgi:hypothetical protein
MHARAILLLALTLGGCSVSGVVTDWASDDAAGPEPMNYRNTVAIGLDGIIGSKDRPSRILEISRPRRVDVIRGAAWMVCVKSMRDPTQVRDYYGVIMQREKIVESRIAVETDGCQIQSYEPFDWNSDMTHPVLR